jgi:hypothetical protein
MMSIQSKAIKVESDSDYSQSGQCTKPNSSDNNKRSKQQRRSEKPNDKAKKPRSLNDIKADLKNSKQVPPTQGIPSQSPKHSSAEDSSHGDSQPEFIATPVDDGWDTLVEKFQETFQDFREAVVTGRYDEVESASAFMVLQSALKEVGGSILQASQSEKAEGPALKAKCRQFFQYVSSFSHHHKQSEMHDFFMNLFNQTNQGRILSLLCACDI